VKFADEYRDPDAARRLTDAIRCAAPQRPVRIMEFCGGHTHTIHRCGIPAMLPPQVEMVHGPGCPVCVVPMGRIDDAVAVARTDGVTLCAYGDVVRVPGGSGSLLDARASGADVRVVYSPTDALDLARRLPERQVVFLAIGFETTAPATAATVLLARRDRVANFSVLCNHVRVVPPLRAILDSPGQSLDGFIGPGHVSCVIGTEPYRFVADDHSKPVVVSGFEPLDILQGILTVCQMVARREARVVNQYRRVVRPEGNKAALDLMGSVFVQRPHFEFRGLGSLPHGGHALGPEFADFDAEVRFGVPGLAVADPKVCQCGDVLRGAKKPWECKVFGTACTPEHPIGTCMVSSEGACAAYYTYARHGAATTIGARP